MRLRYLFGKGLEAVESGYMKQTSQRELIIDRFSMSPHQYWVAIGKGMERPYTGRYWFNQEVGTYHCAHCESSLFSFDAKFKSPNGYASFFNHVKNSIKIEDSNVKEQKDVKCRCCDSFVGKVYFDGPPPTFIRYSINSCALNLKVKEFNKDPYVARIEKKRSKIPKERVF